MLLQLMRTRRKQVLIDINTQRGYLLAKGHACIRNHRRVLGHIRRIMAWTRHSGIPIISTCQVQTQTESEELDLQLDQRKVGYTILRERAISFPAENSMDLPRDVLRKYQQVILHKRSPDPFDEPRIDRLLSELHAEEFLIIGTTAEETVQAVVLGLLQRHKPVTVISDAIGTHNPQECKIALRKMEAKGAKMVETRKIAGSSHLRFIGACGCELCQQAAMKSPLLHHHLNS